MSPKELLARIHAQALGYPEAYEELPWGHPAIKVRKKAFLFCSNADSEAPSISLKLPSSHAEARALPWVEPTRYGMARSGWCTATLPSGADLDPLLDWLDESYRAIAPKTVVKKLGEGRPDPVQPAPVPVTDQLPRVLIVGAGPKRVERAVLGLAAGAIIAASVDLDGALDAAGGLEPELILVDLGREAPRAREVAVALTVVCPDATLVLAGLRGGETDLPAAALRSGDPPGDPAVVAKVIALLEPSLPDPA